MDIPNGVCYNTETGFSEEAALRPAFHSLLSEEIMR